VNPTRRRSITVADHCRSVMSTDAAETIDISHAKFRAREQGIVDASLEASYFRSQSPSRDMSAAGRGICAR
jgi:hypothetical protein